MKYDLLHLWFLGDPQAPRPVGTLRLVDGGKGVSLQYGSEWIASGFALSEDLPLIDLEHARATGSLRATTSPWARWTTPVPTAGASA